MIIFHLELFLEIAMGWMFQVSYGCKRLEYVLSGDNTCVKFEAIVLILIIFTDILVPCRFECLIELMILNLLLIVTIILFDCTLVVSRLSLLYQSILL